MKPKESSDIRTFGLVDRALDSRSKGLIAITAGHVWKCRAIFSFHIASAKL